MRSASFARVAVCFIGAAIVAACGGASDSGFFAGSGGAASGDSGAIGDAAGGGADGSGGGADGSAGHDGGGGAHDASTGHDAAPPPQDAAPPPPPDASPVGNDPGIYCGKELSGNDVFCNVGSEDCCAAPALVGGTPNYSCIAAGGSCSGAIIACDDTADCSGKICCGAFDSSTSKYKEVICRSSCSGNGPSNTTLVRFCDPSLSPSDCPQGSCSASTALPGFFVCQ